jgi:hypothetical protein
MNSVSQNLGQKSTVCALSELRNVSLSRFWYSEATSNTCFHHQDILERQRLSKYAGVLREDQDR